MKKILMSNLFVLVVLVWSCSSKKSTENTDTLAVATQTVVIKTPEDLIKETDLNVAEGDSIVNSIESTEESLEGGEDVAYFNSDLYITKIKKSNFGETYQNEDIFYYNSKGSIYAITSETFRYNRSTYEESSVPMVIKSEGKHTMTFDSTGKQLSYQKVNNKRKMEEKFNEKQELDYWLKRGKQLFETYSTQSDKFFFSRYESAQYDATHTTPILVYKIKNQLFSIIDVSTEPDGRNLELNSPIMEVVKLIYDPNSETWKQSQKATMLNYSNGDVSVNDKIEKAMLDGRTFVFISFKTKETKTGNTENYYTLIDTLDLSMQSLIKSKGKDNSSTFTSEAVKQFLLEKAK